MNKTSYDSAFEILRIQNNVCNQIEGSGLSFEYGSGFVGSALLKLFTNATNIIKASLGLHVVSENCVCKINGIDYPTTVCVLYTEDNSPDWAVTEDDFNNFLNEAIENKILQTLMWEAIVNKNVQAKMQLNSMVAYFEIGWKTGR